MKDTHTVIVGGGVIGLSIAWRLARAGRRVTIVERGKIGYEASRLAAGILGAAAEVGFEESELYDLCRHSLEIWPDFVRELEADSGMVVDYRSNGTLIVANDRDSTEALRREYAFQQEQGYSVEWLSASDVLEVEPFLSPKIVAAVRAPKDHSVDNRKVLKALHASILKLGGTVLEHTEVRELDMKGPEVLTHLRIGEPLKSSSVVLSVGAWSRQIGGIPEAAVPPVRPVKGQILELQMEDPFTLHHVIRGPGAYLVPRSDGRLIVGATSEEMGFDKRLTAGGVYKVLEGAWEVVPGIYDQKMLFADVGLRPGSRDHQPIFGFADDPRLYIATGHFRHGVVLAAVTAMESAKSMLSGSESKKYAHFSPSRFTSS